MSTGAAYRRRYYRLRDEGVCTVCGRADATHGVLCERCRIAATATAQKHKAKRIVYRQEHKAILLANTIRWRANVRLQVLAGYGNRCEWCGEDELNSLEVDHCRDDGNKERKSIKPGHVFYRHLIKSGFPRDRYRLLCASCHVGRHRSKDPAAFEARRRLLGKIRKKWFDG